jgi:hypothetical protein
MVATENQPPTPESTVDPVETKAALDRGEIVRLLAAVESGRIDSDQFLAILEEHERRHWLRRWLLALLGR